MWIPVEPVPDFELTDEGLKKLAEYLEQSEKPKPDPPKTDPPPVVLAWPWSTMDPYAED